jgi:hypothetical protein
MYNQWVEELLVTGTGTTKVPGGLNIPLKNPHKRRKLEEIRNFFSESPECTFKPRALDASILESPTKSVITKITISNLSPDLDLIDSIDPEKAAEYRKQMKCINEATELAIAFATKAASKAPSEAASKAPSVAASVANDILNSV